MPKNVKLKVSSTTKGAGWTKVPNKNYWYKWSGGNGGSDNGNNKFNIGGAQSFDITFIGSEKGDYKFVNFLNKNNAADLSGSPSTTGDKLTVTDQCTTVGDFNYGVTVETKSKPPVSFECDPVISNKLTQLK